MSTLEALPAPALSPHRLPARKTRGLPGLWHFAAEYLLALPVGAAIALVWANLHPESYFRTVFALEFFVSDVAMVAFFGLIAKEVVEATTPGGALHPWRRMALPLAGAVGLTLVPAWIFASIAADFGEPIVRDAWPATFAIDLAFGYFIAIVIFGRHPVIPFFLLLALAADAFGFVILAPAAAASQLQYRTLFTLMAAAIAACVILRRQQTTRLWPYVAIGGGLSWLALLLGGVHPALALVPIVPFLPHAARDPGFFVDAPPDALDTLNRFERWCRHPAQVALLLFGLITAGIPLRALDWGTLAMPVAIVIGKPVGLLLALALALGFGLHLPFHVGWRHLVVVAFITTIGFTMTLFFASVAVGHGPVLSEIKMGAVMTLLGAPIAIVVAWLLRVGRFGGAAHRSADAG
jgi:NhaA family Na+:H+ antiporter